MQLLAIGAGFPRTGTTSLQCALDRILGAPAYTMETVFRRLQDVVSWQAALDGSPRAWVDVLVGYAAACDWPSSAFWEELADDHPRAIVVLSYRDPGAWWQSMDRTVLAVARRAPPPGLESWHSLLVGLLARCLGSRWDDEASAVRAFLRHNDHVRRSVPPERLVDWRPEQGWGPLCTALGSAVPDEAFPHLNTTTDFLNRRSGRNP
jgi:hypothetical protein